MSKKVLNTFSDIFFVKGHKRSIICDLTRNNFKLIPNSLTEFLNYYKNKTQEEILQDFSDSDKNIANEYLAFLSENEYIFWCDKEDGELFPPLSLEWEFPGKISNAVIEISNDINEIYLKNILEELENLGCKHIQFISNETINSDILKKINILINESAYLSIEFVLKHPDNFESNNYLSLINDFPRIKSIIFHSATEDRLYTPEAVIGALGNLLTTAQKPLKNIKDREFGNFSTNMQIFTEAQKHNLYFNRKVVIDKNGNIKNHLNSTEIHGNTAQNKIEEIISKKEFQKLWFIPKSIIKVCKDCEFRFVCVDDRFDLIKDGDYWKYQSECQYNPYIAKHNKQEGYRTVGECKKNES